MMIKANQLPATRTKFAKMGRTQRQQKKADAMKAGPRKEFKPVTEVMDDVVQQADAQVQAPLKEIICEYMDVSPFVVTSQLRSGGLPAVKFGREWRVARQDFEDWINIQREQTEAVVET